MITYFNPKHIKFNLALSAVLFMFWKSSLSTDAIDFYNKFAFIQTSRVVDYTDYIALVMLPFVYWLIKKIKENPEFLAIKTKLNSVFVLIPTVFILISETPPRSHYITQTDSNFRCHNCKLKVNMTQAEVLEKFGAFNIKIDTIFDSSVYNRYALQEDSLRHYTIKEFIIDNDTLRNTDISLRSPEVGKTIISLNGFDYNKDISNQKMKRKLQRHFRKITKDYFKKL
nr:hypothetical protein [uncultured Psychroserpens sp.]